MLRNAFEAREAQGESNTWLTGVSTEVSKGQNVGSNSGSNVVTASLSELALGKP